MTYTATDFWRAFGENRFTKADLWRAFGLCQFPGFATPEWLAEIGIGRETWIEPAPGPRGGEGWRLSDKKVKAMKAADAERLATQAQGDALLAAITPRIGTCRVEGNWLEWRYFPPYDFSMRSYKRKWSVNTKATKVQLDLDVLAETIVRDAQNVRENYLKTIKNRVSGLSGGRGLISD